MLAFSRRKVAFSARSEALSARSTTDSARKDVASARRYDASALSRALSAPSFSLSSSQATLSGVAFLPLSISMLAGDPADLSPPPVAGERPSEFVGGPSLLLRLRARRSSAARLMLSSASEFAYPPVLSAPKPPPDRDAHADAEAACRSWGPASRRLAELPPLTRSALLPLPTSTTIASVKSLAHCLFPCEMAQSTGRLPR
mmetsp:Transcript_41894/g.73551  ORF Transcript_41894/g.73551 Transcript_41894/m.73551 type:complete len:201 (+) Transcript_41894:750-1352(+)